MDRDVDFRRLRHSLDGECDTVGARRITRGGRLRAVFSESELTLIGARLGDAIGKKTAARELGVKVDRVDALIDAGRLSLTPDGRLSRLGVLRVRDDLLRCAAPFSDVETGFVSVAEGLKRWIPVRKTAEFIDAVCSGEISCRALPEKMVSIRATFE